jgi:predicted N-formylglutamate amidohydrolase
MKIAAWLLSCEHGGKRVPARYRPLFTGAAAQAALQGHGGCDLGALRLAKRLAAQLRVPLLAADVTRLLVDLNRSRGHPALFSEWTAPLGRHAKRMLLERYYDPHRSRVEAAVAQSPQPVCHIGVHSFAPALRGLRRRADVGLLYDPARPRERALCHRWKQLLRELAPALRVRRNDPYRGASDGLTTALRRRFGAGRYLGIELEINQALLTGPAGPRRNLERILAASLLRLHEECAAA